MPARGTIMIWNHANNLLEGPREDNSSSIFEFKHNVRLPYDPETNKVQGVRRIEAFSVTKEIDKLTPQLYDIVCNGRQCKKVQITLFRIAAETGEEEEYFYYILEEAKIVSVKNFMPITKVLENEARGHEEKVQFLAKKFTWKYLEGGIEYTEVAV